MAWSARGWVQQCRRAYAVARQVVKDFPMLILSILGILILIASLAYLIHCTFRRCFGVRLAVLLDSALGWLLLRMIARAIIFPGSILLVQRNVEAQYCTRLARQYAIALRQLRDFLKMVAEGREDTEKVTIDYVVGGFQALERMNRIFRMQQSGEVQLSEEQAKVHAITRGVDQWLTHLSVRVQNKAGAAVPRTSRENTTGEVLVPLSKWLLDRRREGLARFYSKNKSVGLKDGDEEVVQEHIAQIDQLLTILHEIRQSKNCLSSMRQLLQVPVLGSLHELRADMQWRYGGQQCWVKTRSGRLLDAMYIPREVHSETEDGNEDAVKVGSYGNPVLVWFNPNAAYYETMLYQPTWLDYYLQQGFSVFFFNYGGFGRSSGRPTPTRIIEDGDSVIHHLRSKGVTQIAVHGLSIGGIPACYVAKKHPDIVRWLIADRTMSSLDLVARCTYGRWASLALQAGAITANNTECYLQARCHKVMIADPKDHMIPGLSQLRNAIATEVIDGMAPEDRFDIDDLCLMQLTRAWRFLVCVVECCADGEEAEVVERTAAGVRVNPVDSLDDLENRCQPRAAGITMVGCEKVDVAWLQANEDLVRAEMALFKDAVHSALSIVGHKLEASGVQLEEALSEAESDPCRALRAFLANLQVWGSVTPVSCRGWEQADLDRLLNLGGVGSNDKSGGAAVQISAKDMESFLHDIDSDFHRQTSTVSSQVSLSSGQAGLEAAISADMVSAYYLETAHSKVAEVRKDFHHRMVSLAGVLSHGGPETPVPSPKSMKLRRTVLYHFEQIDAFLARLGRFFQSLEIPRDSQATTSEVHPTASGMDEEVVAPVRGPVAPGAGVWNLEAPPRQKVDREVAGYLLPVDCGHNGVLSEADFRHLSVHLKLPVAR